MEDSMMQNFDLVFYQNVFSQQNLLYDREAIIKLLRKGFEQGKIRLKSEHETLIELDEIYDQ